MNAPPQPTALARRLRLIVLFLIVIAAAAVLAWYGASFYRLSLDDRVEHPLYRELKPGGNTGHLFGIVATLLVFANLLYLAKRKLPRLIRFGSMQAWLDMHVFTGLLGGVLAAYHSAFQLRTPLATVTAASLGVVVLTGIVGRFLYALAPKTDARPVVDAIGALEERAPGTSFAVAAAIDAHPPTEIAANASLLRCLVTLPRWRRESGDRAHAVELVLHGHPSFVALQADDRRAARRLASRLVRAARGEVRAIAAGALLRSWRGLHRFFALLMLVTVVVHIGVAWYYGYRWIFSE